MFIDILLNQIIVLRLAQRNDPKPNRWFPDRWALPSRQSSDQTFQGHSARSVGVGLARDGGSQPLRSNQEKRFAPTTPYAV